MQIQGGDLMVDRHQIFLNWSEEKFRLEEKNNGPSHFYEREVWWTVLGKNIGHEIDGKSNKFSRPVLIIRRFSSETCLILPLTTQIRSEKPFRIHINFKKLPVGILLDQSRTISSKRLLKPMGSISLDQFEIIKENFRKLL